VPGFTKISRRFCPMAVERGVITWGVLSGGGGLTSCHGLKGQQRYVSSTSYLFVIVLIGVS